MSARSATFAEMEWIIGADAPVFARMIGVPGFAIRLEQARDQAKPLATRVAGIRWNAASKDLVVAPEAFLADGYSAEEVVYAIVIEILVNVRQPLAEPDLSVEVDRFVRRGEGEAIFYGVLSGLAASRRAHAILPRWERVGRRIYERLYPEDEYLDVPRHLQFLYKIAREQMIPRSTTRVAAEVDDLLGEFHDYLGTGRDLLDYSTQHARSTTELMTGTDQFSIWTRNIYPRWAELVELDRAAPRRPTRRVTTGERRVAALADQPRTDFAEYYERHRTRRQHRSPHNSEQEALRRALTRRSRDERSNPALLLDAQLRAETGHGRGEHRRYVLEIERYREQVDEIRGLYRQLLQSHLDRRRTLRGGRAEGAVLSPERLAQTMLEIRTGAPDPPAFSDYETRVIPREHAGRADYVFAFDRSGSMAGAKSAAAAGAAVICLEAFAGMQRDAETLVASTGVDLDVDVRCAIFTYNDTVSTPKPLSTGLTLQERLDTVSQVRSPSGGNADTHVLQAVLDYPTASDRTRTLVVVSDGEADDPELARAKVEQLRRMGWRVYGISIGSDAAVQLYAPHSHRVDDPALVPQVMRRLVEETL